MRAEGDIKPNPNPTPAYAPKEAVPKPDDPTLNELVELAKSFKPAVNISSKKCGIGRSVKKAADGRKLIVFKTDCEDIKSDWKITMSKKDWAAAKENLYETRDKDGQIINFTNLKADTCTANG